MLRCIETQSASLQTHKTSKTGLRTQNVSSEEPSIAESASGAKAKRWSGFFGTSKDTTRMETLVELLDSYNKTGIPGAQEIVDSEGKKFTKFTI